jgi:hypothetical protein
VARRSQGLVGGWSVLVQRELEVCGSWRPARRRPCSGPPAPPPSGGEAPRGCRRGCRADGPSAPCRDIWAWWGKDYDEAQRRADLQAIAQTPAAEIRLEVNRLVEEVAGDRPPATRTRLATYLNLVPGAIKQSLRRQRPSAAAEPEARQRAGRNNLAARAPCPNSPHAPSTCFLSRGRCGPGRTGSLRPVPSAAPTQSAGAACAALPWGLQGGWPVRAAERPPLVCTPGNATAGSAPSGPGGALPVSRQCHSPCDAAICYNCQPVRPLRRPRPAVSNVTARTFLAAGRAPRTHKPYLL